MRISGTETSSLIKQRNFKELIRVPKIPKQNEAKLDGVINPQNCNFNQFLTRKILMLSKRYENQPKLTKNLATCALGDSLV